ncbi:MAG: leucine-rich repeat protein [Clostridia bacterium]|nr:leucine-rich repeat protein [Clostridia bacterium]
MKKFLSLILVSVMLLCMIPFTSSAAYTQDELPGFEGTGYVWDRLCMFNINLNGGKFNANSGAVCGAVQANALNIVDGFSGQFQVYVYHPANTPVDAGWNTYLGVIYYYNNRVSPTYYYLGDLMTVLYNSTEKDGATLDNYLLEGAAPFTAGDFAVGIIAAGILNGSMYTYTATWSEAAPKQYTLTLDTAGGTMPAGYSTTYTFTDDQLLNDVIGGYPVPTKSGYVFKGWKRGTSSDLWETGWGTQPYTWGQDITVTAQWEEEVVTPTECENHSFVNKVCTVCGAALQTSYTVGDYTYTYADSNKLGASAGWNVVVTDTTKTSYGAINGNLHGIPVTVLSKTYDGCTKMTSAPAIPATVEVLYNAYKGTAITATPTIPASVVKIYGAFKNCKSLTTITNLPANVTDMTFAFANCSKLTASPAIPTGVTSLWGAFKNCTALKSVASIPTTVENMVEAFDGCSSLTGAVTIGTNNNKRAFRGTAVTDVTVTANVTHFALSCFKTNSTIQNVYYTGAATAWNDITYEGYNTKVLNAHVRTDVKAAEPTVEVKNGRTYICDLDTDNLRDVFIGKGRAVAYRGVVMNKVVGFTAARINGVSVYTYGAKIGAGNYTLCARYNDGTTRLYYFTVA